MASVSKWSDNAGVLRSAHVFKFSVISKVSGAGVATRRLPRTPSLSFFSFPFLFSMLGRGGTGRGGEALPSHSVRNAFASTTSFVFLFIHRRFALTSALARFFSTKFLSLSCFLFCSRSEFSPSGVHNLDSRGHAFRSVDGRVRRSGASVARSAGIDPFIQARRIIRWNKPSSISVSARTSSSAS